MHEKIRARARAAGRDRLVTQPRGKQTPMSKVPRQWIFSELAIRCARSTQKEQGHADSE